MDKDELLEEPLWSLPGAMDHLAHLSFMPGNPPLLLSQRNRLIEPQTGITVAILGLSGSKDSDLEETPWDLSSHSRWRSMDLQHRSRGSHSRLTGNRYKHTR